MSQSCCLSLATEEIKVWYTAVDCFRVCLLQFYAFYAKRWEKVRLSSMYSKIVLSMQYTTVRFTKCSFIQCSSKKTENRIETELRIDCKFNTVQLQSVALMHWCSVGLMSRSFSWNSALWKPLFSRPASSSSSQSQLSSK